MGGHIVRRPSEPWKSHKNARDTINRVRIDTYFSAVVVVGTDLPLVSLSLSLAAPECEGHSSLARSG